MLGIWSRVKKILDPLDSVSQNAEQSTPLATSTNNRPTAPKPDSRIDDFGLLELASGADPVVE